MLPVDETAWAKAEAWGGPLERGGQAGQRPVPGLRGRSRGGVKLGKGFVGAIGRLTWFGQRRGF